MTVVRCPAMPVPQRKPKMQTIATRVSEEVYELINRAAAEDRRTVSDWARIHLEDAARRQLGEADKPGKKRP